MSDEDGFSAAGPANVLGEVGPCFFAINIHAVTIPFGDCVSIVVDCKRV